jgi:hypothetical protein
MEASRERVISIVLNEAEWQAFVNLHPQPVDWLRERIQESVRLRSGQAIVGASPIAPPSAAAAASTTSATTR